jgi:DNA-directed RNA polymerase subunit N (RpoN/RPB10)
MLIPHQVFLVCGELVAMVFGTFMRRSDGDVEPVSVFPAA